MIILFLCNTNLFCQRLKEWEYMYDDGSRMPRYRVNELLYNLNIATRHGTIYQDFVFIDLIKPFFGLEGLNPKRHVEEWDYFLHEICIFQEVLNYYVVENTVFVKSRYYYSLRKIHDLLSDLSQNIGSQVFGINLKQYKIDKLYNPRKFLSGLPRTKRSIDDNYLIKQRNKEFKLIYEEVNKIYD